MPTNRSVYRIPIVDGVSVAIDLTAYFENYYIYGTATTTTSWAITGTGTPTEGMRAKFEYRGIVTLGTSTHISILGTQMPDEYAAKKVNVDAYYNGTVWVVDYQPAFDEDNIIKTGHILADAITTTKILNANVTLDKVAAVTAGSVVMGNASNRPTATAITGVVALSSSGVISHVAGSIVNADVNAAAGLDLTKLAATTASRALVTNSSGFITGATTTATEIGYLNTSSPGVAVASKVLVLGASKQVDTIDITALKVGGVAVTATGTEMNYLSGVTSNVQTQLSAVTTRTGLGTVSADSTLVAATLNGSYMIDSTGAGVTVTLPQASTLADGTALDLTHYKGANTVTIAGYTGDPGVTKTGTTAATASFAINSAGDDTRIILKAGTWYQLR